MHVAASAALIFSALAAFGSGLSAFDDLPVDGTVGDLGNLAEGECFTSVTLRPETITLAPCQSSHDGEVYVRKSLGGDLGEDYPGDEITWEADEVCYDEFASYAGEIFEESAFSYAIFGPDETSWAQGDREVACAITPSRLGSLEGSARRE